MGRPLDEDIIIKILERWQKAFKENSHYVSASDLSLVIKDVRELPTIQSVATDTISRQAALEKVRTMQTYKLFVGDDMILVDKAEVQTELMMLSPAQPEPAIPLSWIENEIKWLKSLDNTFSEITALQISAMVKKWRDEHHE